MANTPGGKLIDSALNEEWARDYPPHSFELLRNMDSVLHRMHDLRLQGTLTHEECVRVDEVVLQLKAEMGECLHDFHFAHSKRLCYYTLVRMIHDCYKTI